MNNSIKPTGIYTLINFSQLSAILLLLTAGLFLPGCKKDLDAKGGNAGNFNRSSSALYPDTHVLPSATATISGVITGNVTLDKNHVWIINGPTYVDSLATLTIEAGTYIKGLDKPNTTTGFPSYIVVRRGGKIIADGTAASPIVFTSQYTSGNRKEGDWGGIVILGKAPVNTIKPQIEGIPAAQIPAALAGRDAIGYGGTLDNDNSGILRNVRIEFAGEIIDPVAGNELNGLTLGGVGSGTTLDRIQVSYGADDAFEFFGGSVNATNLISYHNDDDDFDFDQGYQGSIKFAVSLKDSRIAQFPRSSNPNGIESNNVTAPVVTGGTYATRVTRPVLSNFSILGDTASAASPSIAIGTLFRANSSAVFKNSIVGGFVTGANTATAASTIIYSNNLVHGFTTAGVTSPANTPYVGAASNAFRLVAPYTFSAPDWRYITSQLQPSPALGWSATDLVVTHPGGSLTSFGTETYKGAFGVSTGARWDSTGWASYEPRTNAY